MLPDKRIHRMGHGPGLRPLCGAEGRVRLSTSGVLVNCINCEPQTDPAIIRAQQMAEIERLAAQYRAKHAS